MAESHPGVPATPDPLPQILRAGTLNLLSGASGIGKTALLVGLLRQFRDHTPVFGRTPSPLPGVGYVVVDRPWHGDASVWFERAGIADLPHYSVVDDLGFAPSQFRIRHKGPELLMTCLEQLKLPPGSLVVVDPIALFLGGNLMDYREVGVACIEIQRALLSARYCVVGVCHTAKLKADQSERYLRPQDRILGSGAQLGYTSTQMYFMGPDEASDPDGLYTFLWNPHLAPQETFKLARDLQTGLFHVDGAVSDRAALQTALTPDLLTLLEAIPYPPSMTSMAALVTLHQDAGVSAKTLYRRLKKLESAGLVTQTLSRTWQRATPAVSDGSGNLDASDRL